MIIDIDTAEVLNDKYAKLFFGSIGDLYGLSGRQLSVLMMMVRAIGLGNKNSITMLPSRKKQFAAELGLKSHQQVTNILNTLVSHGVIRKMKPDERFDYEFVINPYIFFSGNDYQRAKVIVDFENGKRNVKAFKNSEEASRWLLEQKEKEKQELNDKRVDAAIESLKNQGANVQSFN
jgi:hypothetical protein